MRTGSHSRLESLRIESPRFCGGRGRSRPKTDLRLGLYLGTGTALWANMQAAHDVSVVEAERCNAFSGEVPPFSAERER